VLIAGLSGDSVWRAVSRDELSIIDDPAAAIAALHS
jgi:hypothetical protein